MTDATNQVTEVQELETLDTSAVETKPLTEAISTSSCSVEKDLKVNQIDTTQVLTSSSSKSDCNCNANLPHKPTQDNTTSNSLTLLTNELNKSKRDLESMVLKYARSERENLKNQNKVEELDKKLKRAIKDNDQLANRIKLLTNDKNQLTDSLNAKVAQLTVLEQKNLVLNDKQGDKLKSCEEQVKKLEQVNEDLLKKIESYKSKEGELLDFSERLSMKHMILQSELDEALKKVPNYKTEYEATLLSLNDLLKEKDKLVSEVERLSGCLKKEESICESLRNEQEANEIRFRSQMDELQNEIKVMRRKHQITNKELMKKIKQLQGRLEKFEPITNTQSSIMTA